MADIALTAAQIAPVFPERARIRTYIAAATITAGQAVYQTSAGKAGVADANDSGKEQFRGIALNGAGAGQAVDVLEEGEIYGFTISGLAYDALVYLSNTAGALADAAGAMTVRCGRVMALADSDLTKILYIQSSMTANWS